MADFFSDELWSNQMKALALGLFSATSLPLGACIGMVTTPSERTTALLMSFGAGALVYAVTVGLFGEASRILKESKTMEELDERASNYYVMLACTAGGALLYMGLNQLLLNCAKSSHIDKIGAMDMDDSYGQPMQFLKKSGSVVSDGPEQPETKHGSLQNQDREEAQSEVQEGHRGYSQESEHFGAAVSMSVSAPTGQVWRKPGRRRTIHAQRMGAEFDPDLDIAIESASSRDPGRDAPTIHRSGTAGRRSSSGSARQAPMEQKAAVAFSMWMGLVLDGIPEALLIGFMTNSGKITFMFVLAIWIANFPEAFSAAAMLKSQGFKKRVIFCQWGFVMGLTGCLAFIGSTIAPSGSTIASAIMEGITGGSMMAMIATAMLPEAFHGRGGLAGALFVAGFVVTDMLQGISIYHGIQDTLQETAVTAIAAALAF